MQKTTSFEDPLETAYEPVSLGERCETKYQAARVQNNRLRPDRSQMAFRYRIGMPTRDAAVSGWRLFDWRTTPLPAVCEYLERDFDGVFEFSDLELTEIGVKNARFGTYHVHEFIAPPGQKGLTITDIALQYPQARRRFDLLVEDFRSLLHRPGPYLYIHQNNYFPEAALLQRLVNVLGRDPSHRFHVLAVGMDGFDSDLGALEGRVSKGWRGPDSEKPTRFHWEGNDKRWDAILAPFTLCSHEAGHHDPTTATGWSQGPDVGAFDTASPTRVRQPAIPPQNAKVAWRGGPESVLSFQVWLDQGATLTPAPDGVHIRTTPIAWTYSQAVRLDFSQVDLARHDAWVRLKIADASGVLLASLYDPVRDIVSGEVPVEETAAARFVFFPLIDLATTMLILRTGQYDAAAEATVCDIDIVVSDR